MLCSQDFLGFFAFSRTGTSIISGSSNGHCHISNYIKYTYFPEGTFKATIRHSTEGCCDSANEKSDSHESLTGLKFLRLTGPPPFPCYSFPIKQPLHSFVQSGYRILLICQKAKPQRSVTWLHLSAETWNSLWKLEVVLTSQ